MNKYQEYEDAKEILNHLRLTPEQFEPVLNHLAEELGL